MHERRRARQAVYTYPSQAQYKWIRGRRRIKESSKVSLLSLPVFRFPKLSHLRSMMLSSSALVISLAGLALVSAAPAQPQHSGYGPPPNNGTNSTSPTGNGTDTSQQAAQRAQAVKDAFETAWDGYYKYAFPNDELLPVNNSFANTLSVLLEDNVEPNTDTT